MVLVNSNPATIMTDPEFADATYVEPITPEFVEKVIEKERPDALLATLGGQTALNTAIALDESGVLEKYGVELIGASIEAIDRGENRESFKQIVEELGGAVATSRHLPHHGRLPRRRPTSSATRWSCARRSRWAAPAPGWPTTRTTCAASPAPGWRRRPTTEVLLEESILGWKEYELEVMRDQADNVVIVCSIENLDPMGVHTGDSITVAPAMTLTDREYQHLRDLSIGIIRSVGVDTGGCNIQFAVNPDDGRVVVIEMNPRVSRSSRAGVEGDRLPDRQDRGQGRDRLHPRRDPQRHHHPRGRPEHAGQLRADARLRRGEGAAVRVREVPRRRPDADHPHEVGGRGDGDRPQLHRGAAEGAALAGEQGRAVRLEPPSTSSSTRTGCCSRRSGSRTTAGCAR